MMLKKKEPMYATYSYLVGGNNQCKVTSTTAFTDSTRFSCSNLAIEPTIRNSIQSPITSDGNPECHHSEECNRDSPGCNYQCSQVYPTSFLSMPSPALQPQLQAPPLNNNNSNSDNVEDIVTMENYCPLGKTPISSLSVSAIPITRAPPPPKTSPITNFTFSEVDTLLPVMDPRFNLREICKQCILLEDHLTHPEKRCIDCCIKHFLTIEALAEEAVTLDKDQKYQNLIEIPVKVRSLQDIWFKNPEESAHIVSQKLREIRKTYQIDNFDIIFRNDKKQCSGGVCSIKKKKK